REPPIGARGTCGCGRLRRPARLDGGRRSGDVVAGTVVLITYWQTNVCEKWRSCPMKKKSTRGIPDFAPKKPHLKNLDKLKLEKQPPKPPTVAPNIKPQATAAKGNRRGG